MIDAAVVAAYLGAAVARGGRHLLDTMIDHGPPIGSQRRSVRRLGPWPGNRLGTQPRQPRGASTRRPPARVDGAV
jgi:hypothetical protein